MLRKSWIYLLIVFAFVVLVVVFFRPSEQVVKMPISTVIADVSAGLVSRIEIRGDDLDVTLKDLSSYHATKEDGVSLFTIFADRGVDPSSVVIEVDEGSRAGNWLGLLLNFLPLILFFGLLFYGPVDEVVFVAEQMTHNQG